MAIFRCLPSSVPCSRGGTVVATAMRKTLLALATARTRSTCSLAGVGQKPKQTRKTQTTLVSCGLSRRSAACRFRTAPVGSHALVPAHGQSSRTNSMVKQLQAELAARQQQQQFHLRSCGTAHNVTSNSLISKEGSAFSCGIRTFCAVCYGGYIFLLAAGRCIRAGDEERRQFHNLCA